MIEGAIRLSPNPELGEVTVEEWRTVDLRGYCGHENDEMLDRGTEASSRCFRFSGKNIERSDGVPEVSMPSMVSAVDAMVRSNYWEGSDRPRRFPADGTHLQMLDPAPDVVHSRD